MTIRQVSDMCYVMINVLGSCCSVACRLCGWGGSSWRCVAGFVWLALIHTFCAQHLGAPCLAVTCCVLQALADNKKAITDDDLMDLVTLDQEQQQGHGQWELGYIQVGCATMGMKHV
eukprot:GHRQ01030592.1.p1 GENE.GHRQ01030592.1~~GHRQ01030592.1.p1  ORF type:complete len:117 (-),score=24.71 GHRQ01030592.1:10-360(-)